MAWMQKANSGWNFEDARTYRILERRPGIVTCMSNDVLGSGECRPEKLSRVIGCMPLIA
jgi:hypothetical protein